MIDFIFLGSKITVDDDCSHEIKRHLLFRRKAMTNLHSIWKSRDITLWTKVHLDKAMVVPEVMCGCESWIIKKDENQRIDAFELWTAKRSNQSILKKISPEYSLEHLMLKLMLLSFILMQRADSLEKTLTLGKIEGRWRRGWQRMRWLDASLTWWTWVWASSRSCWWTGKPGVLQFMGLQRVIHDWATELTEPHTHTHTHTYTHIEIYHRNWLLLTWRLRSPTICHPQAGEEEKLLV